LKGEKILGKYEFYDIIYVKACIWYLEDEAGYILSSKKHPTFPGPVPQDNKIQDNKIVEVSWDGIPNYIIF
jgi:hypothetical protein